MGNEAQTPQKRAVEKVAADLVAQFVGTTLDVSTGELRAAKGGLLRASAIGSCVAVALYDPVVKLGGLAHVMLPGNAPQKQNIQRTKYVENGMRELVKTMTDLGAQPERLEACVAGGGNVLDRQADKLCDANIASAIGTLDQLGIALMARDVGGTQRRSLTIDVKAGRVSITVGDAAPTLLWDFGVRDDERG